MADTLSNQLSLRPGPLELIQKNILHTDDDQVDQAVKEGHIPFRPTAEGLPAIQVSVPHKYSVSGSSFDEDSASDAQPSPQNNHSASVPSPSAASVPSPTSNNAVSKSESSDSVFSTLSSPGHSANNLFGGVIAVSPAPVAACAAASDAEAARRRASDAGVFAVPSPLPSVASPAPSVASSSGSGAVSSSAYSQRGAPGKDQSRKKKSKPKATKARTIKFHEYKVLELNEVVSLLCLCAL